MSVKKVVHTDDVTSVESWNSPVFEDEKNRSNGDEPNIIKTLDEEQLAKLNKQAKFSKHIANTDEFSRVGIWDGPEFTDAADSHSIDPKN